MGGEGLVQVGSQKFAQGLFVNCQPSQQLGEDDVGEDLIVLDFVGEEGAN